MPKIYKKVFLQSLPLSASLVCRAIRFIYYEYKKVPVTTRESFEKWKYEVIKAA